MAIAFVNSWNNFSTSSNALAITISPSAGNTVVVWVMYIDSPSPSDDFGANLIDNLGAISWNGFPTKLAFNEQGAGRIRIYGFVSPKLPSGITTITARTFVSGVQTATCLAVFVEEYSGVAGANTSLFPYGTNFGASNVNVPFNADVPSLAASQTGSLFVGASIGVNKTIANSIYLFTSAATAGSTTQRDHFISSDINFPCAFVVGDGLSSGSWKSTYADTNSSLASRQWWAMVMELFPDHPLTDSAAFIHLATYTVSRAVSASTTVAFSDGAARTKSWALIVSDAIGFSGGNQTTESRQITVPTDSIVFVDQGRYSVSWSRLIADSIAMSDHILKNDITVPQSIAFSHLASAAGSIYFRTIVDSIKFTDKIGRIFTILVADAVALSDSGVRGPNQDIFNFIVFTDSHQLSIQKPLTDSIVFVDSASRAPINFVRNVTDAIAFSDYANRATSLVPCDTYATSLGASSNFVLSYPTVSPSTTVVLRVPRFGDKRYYTVSTKVKRTTEGFLRVTRASTWPKIEQYQYAFKFLTAAVRDALFTFLDLTAGQNIKIVDQDNVAWIGIVTNPVVHSSQEGIGCQYSVEFTFRGVKA